jgi:hypothetical protein
LEYGLFETGLNDKTLKDLIDHSYRSGGGRPPIKIEKTHKVKLK